MKPEEMAQKSFNSIPDQLDKLLRTKPDEVFTVEEANELIAGGESSIRVYVRKLPDNQKMHVKQGNAKPVVFGSVAAIKKLRKLMG